MFPDEVDTQTEDSSLHGGRIRSFKHERGNWATYVYVPCKTRAQYCSCSLIKSYCDFSSVFFFIYFVLCFLYVSSRHQTKRRKSLGSCLRNCSQLQGPAVWFWSHRRSSTSLCLRQWCWDTIGFSPLHRVSGQAWHTATGVVVFFRMVLGKWTATENHISYSIFLKAIYLHK